jgi:hypothetical protein
MKHVVLFSVVSHVIIVSHKCSTTCDNPGFKVSELRSVLCCKRELLPVANESLEWKLCQSCNEVFYLQVFSLSVSNIKRFGVVSIGLSGYLTYCLTKFLFPLVLLTSFQKNPKTMISLLYL